MGKRSDYIETSKKYFKSVPLELNLTESNFAIQYLCSDRATILFSFAGVAYIHQRQQ